MLKVNYRGWTVFLLFFILVCFLSSAVSAENYTSSDMRLLHYEGTVEIEDPDGNPRFVMENVRFENGEAMSTGKESTASVSLDSSKIVTLDEESRVEFAQQANQMKLTLTEGTLFLDVEEKLADNESLEIATSTMVVGIRGTIVVVRDMPSGDGQRETTLGVLEGNTQVSWLDEAGSRRSQSVGAGQKAVMEYSPEGEKLTSSPAVSELTFRDIEGFTAEQVNKDPALLERVNNACNVMENETGASGESEVEQYPEDGDWTYGGEVVLAAQSASKMYDGSPLTRTGDVLVYGLPEGLTIKVNASGSQTDAGSSENPIGSYGIYNGSGENVTEHFTNIKKVSGSLVVDPAPLTVWTGSAEKVYDGLPLTDPEIQLLGYPGYERGTAPWRNTSYTITEAVGIQTLYGVSGTIWVHGTNPLTGEMQEIALNAGQRLSVYLREGEDGESIELKIEEISEEEIPVEVLRLYEANPELLKQACLDTGWDMEIISRIIEELPEEEEEKPEVLWNGLSVDEDAAGELMENCTNVRITIDTDITDYDSRALGEEEARFTGIHIDASIQVAATGTITDVGSVPNTYEINWGSANPGNYVLSEEPGTLTVTEAPASVTTGSASKEYDGTPLTNEEASITGLVSGETASVAASGTITEVGTAVNTYTIDWGTAKAGNYALTEDLGVLEVTARNIPEAAITLTAASAEKTYDGKPLTDSSVTVEGLPEGYSCAASASGSRTDAGNSVNTVASYTILNPDGEDVTSSFKDVTTVNGTLTVTPAPLTVTTGSASKEYDGTPLTNSEVSVTGLAEGESVSVTAIGRITDVGTAENSYRISWGETNPDNYTLTETTGTLEVTENSTKISFTASSSSKSYDGTPLTGGTVTVEGLPSGFTYAYTLSGSRTDAGSSESRIESLTIFREEEGGSASEPASGSRINAGGSSVQARFADAAQASDEAASQGKDVTAFFNNINLLAGTLTIEPASVTVKTGSASKVYDGTPLTSAEASITGLVEGETASVTATGSMTDVGPAVNTYTIEWGDTSPDNYTITEDLGTLEVKENDTAITITAGSANRAYDGKPLMVDTATVDGELPADFSLDFEISGSQTDAGSSASKVQSIVIYNAAGKAVTSSFTGITTEDGTLTVTKAPLTVTTESASKMYDGTPLTASGASVDGLAAGESVSVTTTGSITNVGTADNTYTIDWGGTKPDNYTVTEAAGTLEITPNSDKITFMAYGVEGWYSGNPVSDAMVEADGLPSGFTYTAETSGSRTYPGSSPVTVSSYGIFNADGEDVTDNFSNIETVDGIISIMPATISITTGSASKEYDGSPLTESSGTISGLVNGETATLKMTGSQTGIGKSDNTYEIEWGTADPANYSVGAEDLGTLEVTENASPITLTAASAQKTYDGTALTEAGVTVEGLPSGLSVTAEASGSRTDAGSSENKVASYKILNADEEDVTSFFTGITTVDGTLEVTRAEITVTSGSAGKEYDGEPLSNNEAAVSGLKGTDSVSLLATGSQTDAGTSKNEVEIVWDNAKEDNYTVTEEFGTLEVTPCLVEFELYSYDATFCGQKIFPDGAGGTYSDGSYVDLEFAGMDEPDDEADQPLMVMNFSFRGGGQGTLTVDGFTDAGSHSYAPDCTFTSGSKENYSISYTKREMTIDPLPVELDLCGETSDITYDGNIHGGDLSIHCDEEGLDLTPLSGTTWEVEFWWGDKFEVSVTGGGKDAGTYRLSYSCAFSVGRKENYDFAAVNDIISIKPAALTVKSDSAGKMYDGKPLTASGGEAEGLVSGDAVTVKGTGSLTDVGTAENTITIEWGTTNDKNYEVTEVPGTLSVTENTDPVVITSADAEKTYDGTPLVKREVTVSGLPEGFSYQAASVGNDSQTDAGSSPNEISALILDADSRDVTENFVNISHNYGTLTVNPATLTVRTGSAEKVYDGTPLTNPEASLTGVAPGDTIGITATGTITGVGSTPNTYQIAWGSSTKSNYNVVENLGTLEVKRSSDSDPSSAELGESESEEENPEDDISYHWD